ncbi:MAG TPA: NAD(P)-binding domain-containing protein, partial [Pseudolabrys sp.]
MKKPATNQKTLGKFSGHLVLLGAGKMGGAMLDGWTARGFKPKQLVVIDPQAGKPIKALAKRGLALNPKPGP